MSARVAGILTAFLLLFFIGSPAQNLALAQPPLRERTVLSPARGVFMPGVGVAGDGDARSSEVNPGQVGLLEEASSAYVVSYWKNGVERAGRGGGLFLAAPTLIPRLVSSGSFQWLRPSIPDRSDRHYKLALAPGLRLSRTLGVGFTWEHIFGGHFGGLDSFTVGAAARLHPTLAIGLAARDVNRPSVGGVELPIEWDGEAVVRPFADDRLELTAGARLLRHAGGTRVQPRLRLTGRFVKGAAIFVEADRPRFDLEQRDGSRRTGLATDYQLAIGVSAGFGRSGATLAGVRSLRDVDEGWVGDHRPFAVGGHLALHTSFNRRDALFARKQIARVRLEALSEDRLFVQTALKLQRLANDEAVGAVLLVIDDVELGVARIEELRAIIKTIRGRGKPVLAHLSNPGTRDYYLATACDAIAVHPAGGLTLTGLSQTVVFYKGLLDKLGVNVDLVRIAEWKSAMEPFVFERSSDAARDNRRALLDDLGHRLLTAIAEGRRLSPQAVRSLVDRAIFGAEDAQESRLVDAIADDKQMEQTAQRLVGRSWPVRDADVRRHMPNRWLPSRVAVLLVDGAITKGKGGGMPFQTEIIAWSERLLDAIKQLRSDPSVRAVVLRVNSPGGSAFASDEIAREIARLREAKPVVTSMADAAASGGYYIAAPTDAIFASPSTITGSIGIYSYKVDGRALADRIGISAEVTKLGAHADFHSPYRPWTEEEKALSLRRIELLYKRFIGVVAAGRKHTGLSAAQVDRELARGRVWTGAQARARGLVDQEGGLVDAVLEAARRGRVTLTADGLPEVLVVPPAIADPLETLLALRRLVAAGGGAASGTTAGPDAVIRIEGLAAPLLRRGRAAARLIMPVLLGPPVGFEARLPFELEHE